MWKTDYSDKLSSWSNLRSRVKDEPIDSLLQSISDWWFDAPWHPYGLHWDDLSEWPSPWELLEGSSLCPVERGFGILSTLALIEREDLSSARLILTKDGHTMIEVGNYILNWDRQVSSNTMEYDIVRSLTIREVCDRYI